MDDRKANTFMIQEESHQISYLRNGLKPYARNRTVAVRKRLRKALRNQTRLIGQTKQTPKR